jgi:LuxR family transcriptional activator of conjugal transfer of Ti plasmids
MPVGPWKNLDRFIDAVSLVTEEKHFKRSLQNLADSLGYELYAYINISFKSSFALSNYPKEWQDRYLQKSYQRVDPVIEIARRTMAPFTWSLEDRQFRRQQRRGFAREANEFGICSGTTIAIPAGFGHTSFLTFASRETSLGSRAPLNHVPATTAATFTHAFVTLRRPRASASSVVRLAPQETICLRWAAEGKSMREAATLLGIKYSSARSYLDNAREKLGAITLIQAVAIATRLNLI